MSTTPRTDALAGVAMTRKDSDDFARQLERELTAEKAEHADTQRQWNEALDVGLKVVKERDALQRELAEAKALVSERESRLAHIKFLLEPIYGSTNYAPIGSVLERVLDTSDVLRDLPTVAEATGLKGPALALAEQLHRDGHTNLLAKS